MYRTMYQIPIGETPFQLIFGVEAVIPVEFGLPSEKVKNFYETINSDQLRIDLDLFEETREQVHIKMVAYKQRIAMYYNAQIKSKSFQKDDLILRRVEISKPGEQDKFAPNWEGPYRISNVIHLGAYRIENLDGSCIPHT